MLIQTFHQLNQFNQCHRLGWRKVGGKKLTRLIINSPQPTKPTNQDLQDTTAAWTTLEILRDYHNSENQDQKQGQMLLFSTHQVRQEGEPLRKTNKQ